MKEELRIGYIKKYINDRGFGFIQDIFSESEIFFHFRVFHTPELKTYQDKEDLYLFYEQDSPKKNGKNEVSSICNIEKTISISDLVAIISTLDKQNLFNLIKTYYKFSSNELDFKKSNNSLHILYTYLIKNNINIKDYFESSNSEIIALYDENTVITNKLIEYIPFFDDNDVLKLRNKIVAGKVDFSLEDYLNMYLNNLYKFKKILYEVDKSVIEYITLHIFNENNEIIDADKKVLDRKSVV
jgi:cold shock CspA family protein